MHKFILVTAIFLASTAAQAGGTRGLITVASTEAADPVKPAEQTTPAAQAPVAPALCAEAVAPKSAGTQPADAKPVDVLAQHADAKPARKISHDSDRAWTEHRIRSELARYGIY
jgi:hypothetical protein